MQIGQPRALMLYVSEAIRAIDRVNTIEAQRRGGGRALQWALNQKKSEQIVTF